MPTENNNHIDILFITVGNIDEDDRKEIPLGIAYLSGQLIKYNYKYEILDLYNLGIKLHTKTLIRHYIKTFRPKLIGISATSYYIDLVREVIVIIREILKEDGSTGIPIILGGYISIIPSIIEETGADIVCYGEGEKTLLELLDILINHSKNISLNLNQIDGISFIDKTTNKLIKTKRRELIENLDELSFPDYSKFDLNAYNFFNSLPFYSQRGCYNNCSFCDIVDFYHEKYIRHMSPSRIMEWIKTVKEKYNIIRIDFMDDNFLNSRNFITGFFEKLNINFPSMNEVYPIKINFQARSNEIIRFKDILKENKNYINCIEIGTESYSSSQLKRWKKNQNVLDNIRANEILSKIGIPYLNFYLWLDEYTSMEELDENVEKILELPKVNIIGTNISIPNYIQNYEISAIYDRRGNSVVRNDVILSNIERYLNETNQFAKELSIMYIAFKKLMYSQNPNENKNKNVDLINRSREISISLFPMIEEAMKKRMFLILNLYEVAQKVKINKKKHIKKITDNYINLFKEIYSKIRNPFGNTFNFDL